jgi:hypothetical protein
MASAPRALPWRDLGGSDLRTSASVLPLSHHVKGSCTCRCNPTLMATPWSLAMAWGQLKVPWRCDLTAPWRYMRRRVGVLCVRLCVCVVCAGGGCCFDTWYNRRYVGCGMGAWGMGANGQHVCSALRRRWWVQCIAIADELADEVSRWKSPPPTQRIRIHMHQCAPQHEPLPADWGRVASSALRSSLSVFLCRWPPTAPHRRVVEGRLSF